jgi:hypothetical protein
MIRNFYLDTSPIYQNKMIIRFDPPIDYFPEGTEGSYQVINARLLNLSYADYLRYARDRLGAELIGKKTKYVTPYFDDTPAVREFVKLLNKRLEFAMFKQQHPYQLVKGEDGVIQKIPYIENEDNN